MRKIVQLTCVSLVLLCGAVGANARSSDEEDAPQASAESAAAPRALSLANVALRAERETGAGAHRHAAAPVQEDEHVGY